MCKKGSHRLLQKSLLLELNHAMQQFRKALKQAMPSNIVYENKCTPVFFTILKYSLSYSSKILFCLMLFAL